MLNLELWKYFRKLTVVFWKNCLTATVPTPTQVFSRVYSGDWDNSIEGTRQIIPVTSEQRATIYKFNL